MISNQILQNTLDGITQISGVGLCVMDPEGKVAASTADLSSCSRLAAEFALSAADSQEISGHQYFKIYDDQTLEYVLIVGGSGEDKYVVGRMVDCQI